MQSLAQCEEFVAKITRSVCTPGLPRTPTPRIGTSPTRRADLELQSRKALPHPSLKLRLHMEDVVSWNGVWRLPLCPPYVVYDTIDIKNPIIRVSVLKTKLIL